MKHHSNISSRWVSAFNEKYNNKTFFEINKISKSSFKDKVIDKFYTVFDNSGHLPLMTTALNIWSQNKVIGTGPGSFRHECNLEKYKLTLKYKSNSCSTHPHNYYLEILSELGFLGILFFIIFAVKIISDFVLMYKNVLINKYSFHHFMGSMCLPARVEIMAQFSARLCKLGAILHIMYAVLSSLANYFTHYDLHHDNLVLVKAPVNQYIQLRLHLQNGQIVEYKTSYMPVFIDFGHSFVNCTNLNAAIHDSDTIIKTTCRHDQTNQDINQAKCLDNCGDNTGYNWNPNFNYATGTFNPQTAQRYYIDPTRHNISHDIKFLVNLRDNYDYSNVAGVGYMGRTLVSDFLLTKLIPPDTQYGSRENLSMNNDHVYNVHSAFNLLNNIVADPEFNIANNLLYAGQTLYKTIDIWHGQPIAGHQFTSI